MLRRVLFLGALVACLCGALRGQTAVSLSSSDGGKRLTADYVREWTGTGGRKIKGILRDADATTATVAAPPPGTTVYKIALANLSAGDQQVVAEWMTRKQANEAILNSAGNGWRTDVGTFLALMKERTGKVPRPEAPVPGFNMPVIGKKPEDITGEAMRSAIQPFIGQKVTWSATFSEAERLKDSTTRIRFVESGTMADEFVPGGKGRRPRSHPSFNFAIASAPDKVAEWKRLKSGTLVTWSGTIIGMGVNISFIGSAGGYTVGSIVIEQAVPEK